MWSRFSCSTFFGGFMKKIFIKYKQYFKKFLFSFPIFIACFSLIFSLPVSATTGTVFTMAHHQPEASNYDGYLEVYYKSPSSSKYDLYTYFWSIAPLTMKTTENVIFPRMLVNVSKTSLTWSYGFQNNTQTDSIKYVVMTGFMRSSDGYYKTDHQGSSGLPAVNSSFSIPSGYEIVGVKIYGNGYFGTNSIASSNGGSWTVVYGGDNAILRQLEAIKEVLQQQNSNNQAITNNADKNASNIQSNANKNASDIQNNADKNASDIQNNADKNAGDIQNNADKNASDIQANADKNTDIITNGGSDYGTVDKDTSNDYMSKEQELDAATSMSRENTVSLFSNFGSFFLNSKLAKGLTGTTAIMKEFFGISWLSDMANFGLILGAFAFVIGAGFLAGSIHRQKVSSERRSSRGGK